MLMLPLTDNLNITLLKWKAERNRQQQQREGSQPAGRVANGARSYVEICGRELPDKNFPGDRRVNIFYILVTCCHVCELLVSRTPAVRRRYKNTNSSFIHCRKEN